MRKCFAAVLVLTLLLSAPCAALAEPLGTRDETVYALLDGDGAALTVAAVVRADLVAGEYEDTGAYTSVESLCAADVILRDDVISIAMPNDGALYYRGDLPDSTLPWKIALAFTANDEPVAAEAIAGQAGVFGVRLSIAPDPQADPWFARNLTIQAQVPVDLDDMRVLSCEGASCAVTGSVMTIAYNVLPGGSLDAEIVVETDAFSLGEITITALRGVLTIDGADEISTALAGMSEAGGQTDMAGMDMATVKARLAELAAAGAQLTDGYGQIGTGIGQMKTDGAADLFLRVLASQIESGDQAARQTAQLAQNLLDLTAGATQLAEGMGQLNDGLAQYTQGVTQIAQTAGALLEVIEGQESLKLLLGSMTDAEPYTAKSFAGAAGPLRTVQFVIRTAAVRPVAEAAQPASEVGNADTFLARFLKIFGK